MSASLHGSDAGQPLLPRYTSTDGHEPPDLAQENRQWHACHNLDVFFTRLYRYWQEKGFAPIVASRLLNLAALAFTIAMAGFLLLYVNFSGLQADCLHTDSCDISEAAVYKQPMAQGSPLSRAFKLAFLGIFSLYWLWSCAVSAVEIWQLWDIRQFCRERMGLSDAALSHLPWPELLRRLVAVQRSVRLSLRGDLSQHDIIMRIMRKDDYLIGMLNHGTLDLHIPLPILRSRPLLTTSVTWLLRVTMLDVMFDDNFELHQAFLRGSATLAHRFRSAAVASALLAPFILLFLLMHFLLKHLERIYHHPSSLGKRRWSVYAYWRMREYGELPHFVEQRLHSAAEAAAKYCAQFPSPVTSAVAGFVAYVAAGLAALVISIALTHDYLMERPAWGHTLVWWLAACGMVLAVARSLMEDDAPTYDPESAMRAVLAHTHWVPPYWRGKAHAAAVRAEFGSLFQYQVMLFAEEALSVLLLPWLCLLLARSSHDITSFLTKNTVFHSSVGHVCSMAYFDFDPHGNPRYAPSATRALTPDARTRHEKVEQSLVSFAACYPSWKPPDAAVARFVEQFDPACMPPPGFTAPVAARGDPEDGAGVPISAAAMPSQVGSSVAIPGPAIAGAWALMGPPRGSAVEPSGSAGKWGYPYPRAPMVGAWGEGQYAPPSPWAQMPPERYQGRPGGAGIQPEGSPVERVRVQSSCNGAWGDLDGANSIQKQESLDSDAPSVELQRIGVPPPRPRPPTGAARGGFKDTPGTAELENRTELPAGAVKGVDVGRVSYGRPPDAEMKDLGNGAPADNGLWPADVAPSYVATGARDIGRSRQHSRVSRCSTDQKIPQPDESAVEERTPRGPRAVRSATQLAMEGQDRLRNQAPPASPLAASVRNDPEGHMHASRGSAQEIRTPPPGAPQNVPESWGVSSGGAGAHRVSTGSHLWPPRSTSPAWHSYASGPGSAGGPAAVPPLDGRQSCSSFIGTASTQFASPIASGAWSGVSAMGTGLSSTHGSAMSGIHSGFGGGGNARGVGHWHWAASAPDAPERGKGSGGAFGRGSMSSGDRVAWVYGMTLGGHPEDSIAGSMHAAAHDVEFRRAYMHAALQQSYDLAESQRLQASGNGGSGGPQGGHQGSAVAGCTGQESGSVFRTSASGFRTPL